MVMVEDVSTSGRQGLDSTTPLRDLGAKVSGTRCVIDREAGVEDSLAEAGLTRQALFAPTEFRAAARSD